MSSSRFQETVSWPAELCASLLNLIFRVEVQEFTGDSLRPNAGRGGRQTAPALVSAVLAGSVGWKQVYGWEDRGHPGYRRDSLMLGTWTLKLLLA